MRILSIDVGIVNIGYAIFDITDSKITYLSSGYLCTKHKKQTKERLNIIYTFFNNLIQSQNFETLIYEQPIFNRGKSGADVVKAEGVLLLLAGINNLNCFSYTAPNVKKTIAHFGRADKQQVEDAVCEYLNLKLTFSTDHESDAVAIGLTHFIHEYSENVQQAS
jgi:crossover junction endodeoxyribonuclease RuvC